MNNLTEGWTWLRNSRKWHYFRNKQSLCNKYMLLKKPSEGYEMDVESSDNCAICARIRIKEIKNAGAWNEENA
ncbi:hypothetical protein HMPREF0326_03040 [Desulfovibrio sp. 3_1_syn3]|nr:hypothetical protein HMPREF0326_03040 [Desulfovibrio sp. 3_1_syn3]